MKLVLSILLLTLLSGCATLDSLEPGAGQSFTVQGVSYSRLWNVSNAVMARQLTIVSSEQSEGRIKAEKGAGLATWGEVVGLFVTPAREGAQEYKVEVVSLKRSRLQITGQNWEGTVIQGIRAELALQASGR